MFRIFKSRIGLIPALTVALILAACGGPSQPTKQPDQFAFEDIYNAALSTVVTSAPVEVTGHTTRLSAQLASDAEDAVLLINDEPAGANPTVGPGDTVAVRLTSSDEYSTAIASTVRVGNVRANFTVTTMAEPDPENPDTFDFTDVTGATLSTDYTSDTVTLAGFTGTLEATAAGGTLVLNGDDATSPATVEAGDTVALRVTSSAAYDTPTTATLTIGTVNATYTVTTMAEPVAPTIVQFEADTATAGPGDEVLLTWSVTGDFEDLLLSFDGTSTSVLGMADYSATVPANQPDVTFTLTAVNTVVGNDTDAETVGIPLWVCINNDYPITFEDASLEASLREHTDLPDSGPIQCSDMQNPAFTTYSSAHSDGNEGDIESLVGLQHATNLTNLVLQFNEISDLSPIANLTNLEVINFDKNRVLDLSPLENLVALTEVGFWDNGPVFGAADDGIVDISVLASLPNLEVLYLSDNNVSDLSPLAGLSNLRVLYAYRNDLADLSPLANNTALRALAIGFQRTNFSITDSTVFATLPNLNWLDIQFTGLTDLGFLEDLANLYAVRLDGMRLENIDDLLANDDFPAPVPGDLEMLGVSAPSIQTLSLQYNCLDTDAASPTAIAIAALVDDGLTVTGYEPAFQDSCGGLTPDALDALRDALHLQIMDSSNYR